MHGHMIHASVPEDSAPEQSAVAVCTPTKSALTRLPVNLKLNLDAVRRDVMRLTIVELSAYCRLQGVFDLYLNLGK